MTEGRARAALVTGAAGQVGTALVPRLVAAGWYVHATDLPVLDISDGPAVHEAVERLRPDVLVNLAAETDADRCEREPEWAHRHNAEGPRHLAEACAEHGVLLCQLSSDYVFDGDADRPYDTGDATSPLSVYGRTKVAAEDVVLAHHGLVVRTAWLSGRAGTNVAKTALRLAADPQRALAFVDDQRGCPTVAEDLADALVGLVGLGTRGLVHVTGGGDASWYELVAHILEAAGHDPERVQPIATHELVPPRDAARPRYSVLDPRSLVDAGVEPLRPWQDAFADLVHDLVAAPAGTS